MMMILIRDGRIWKRPWHFQRGPGFKIFLIMGRYHYRRNGTERNLVRAGYHSWEAFFLREPEDYEKSVVVYKSESVVIKDGARWV